MLDPWARSAGSCGRPALPGDVSGEPRRALKRPPTVRALLDPWARSADLLWEAGSAGRTRRCTHRALKRPPTVRALLDPCARSSDLLWEAGSAGRRSEPAGVPVRILPKGTNQTGSGRVHEDIARCRLEILSRSQAPVMKPVLPDGADCRVPGSEFECRASFHLPHCFGQRHPGILECHEPMKMIGHHHEAVRSDLLSTSHQRPDQRSCGSKVFEDSSTPSTVRSNQVYGAAF